MTKTIKDNKLYAKYLMGMPAMIEIANYRGLYPMIGKHDAKSEYVRSIDIFTDNKIGSFANFYLANGEILNISFDERLQEKTFYIGIILKEGTQKKKRENLKRFVERGANLDGRVMNEFGENYDGGVVLMKAYVLSNTE
ncbi:MAG: hypothetical protein LBG29_05160 [Synergistaceae bacterium]|nr:hypothetical protein [Synergistaceae bacterium]